MYVIEEEIYFCPKDNSYLMLQYHIKEEEIKIFEFTSKDNIFYKLCGEPNILNKDCSVHDINKFLRDKINISHKQITL